MPGIDLINGVFVASSTAGRMPNLRARAANTPPNAWPIHPEAISSNQRNLSEPGPPPPFPNAPASPSRSSPSFASSFASSLSPLRASTILSRCSRINSVLRHIQLNPDFNSSTIEPTPSSPSIPFDSSTFGSPLSTFGSPPILTPSRPFSSTKPESSSCAGSKLLAAPIAFPKLFTPGSPLMGAVIESATPFIESFRSPPRDPKNAPDLLVGP